MRSGTDIGPPNEHDGVALKRPLRTKDVEGIHEIQLDAGTEGTIVFIGERPGQPTEYMVEFCAPGPITLAMPFLRRGDFEIVWRCADKPPSVRKSKASGRLGSVRLWVRRRLASWLR